MDQLVFTAVVTPFTIHGFVDYMEFKFFCERQFQQGITGLVVGGTTGEAPTLDDAEFSFMVDEVRRIRDSKYPDRRIVANVGTNCTRTTLARLDRLLSSGFGREGKEDGIMVVLPYYNKPNHEGLAEHIRSVVLRQIENGENRLPLMIYHVPGRTAYNIPAAKLAELCNDLEREYPGSIRYIKEATGNAEYSRMLKGGLSQRIALLAGDDALYLRCLLDGDPSYDGVVSVLSNVRPRELILYAERPSLQEYVNLDRLTEFLFSMTNPIPVKFMLGYHHFRPPLFLGPETRRQLEHSLQAYNDVRDTNLSLSSALNSRVGMHSCGNRILIMKHHPVLGNPKYASAIAGPRTDTIVSFREDPIGPAHIAAFYNRDGREAEMCGNGLRCLYSFLKQRCEPLPRFLDRELRPIPVFERDGLIFVNLGHPKLVATIHCFIEGSKVFEGLPFLMPEWGIRAHFINVGNPHLVIYLREDVGALLQKLGEAAQGLFPRGTNLEVVVPVNRDRIRVRIYERGVGITDSCGTGCVAAVFAGRKMGILDPSVTIELGSGTMVVEETKHGYITGATAERMPEGTAPE